MKSDIEYLKQAVRLANFSVDRGGFPCGCLIVESGAVVGDGMSMSEVESDPTAHAEVTAIRSATSTKASPDLSGSILYSSLEPCLMCFHSAYWAGIRRIVFGARKERVSARYYEGSCSLAAAAAVLSHTVRIDFLPDFAIFRCASFFSK